MQCGASFLDLGQPRVMGILNVTPDSFSDGGAFLSPHAALRRAREMAGEGADIIDVGGESTRPGAAPVSIQEELDRVIPVIERLTHEVPAIISVDTSKPEVMIAAAAAGAGLINDVYALRRPGALEAARATGLPVCVMHMRGEPRTMQDEPHYEDVVAEVRAFLAGRVADCVHAGIPAQCLLIDPGFGFGKALAHNLSLFKHLDELAAIGPPLVVGVSRKSMIGKVLGVPSEQRLYGSIALAALAVERGACVLRVHDVSPTVHALKMAAAIANAD